MKLKVFGGLTFVMGIQYRTIVAASSQKKAAELVGVSVGYLRTYWAETGVAIELETALAEPGVVFRAVDGQAKCFMAIAPTDPK